MAREKCGLLAVPPPAPVQLTRYVYTAHVRPSSTDSSVTLRTRVSTCIVLGTLRTTTALIRVFM
jgi:hypothetical protein